MKKKIVANTITATVCQFIVVICGLILPRYVLQYYGSSIYGLTASIAQFIAVISFLDLGVGAVVQSNFYKPLVEKNSQLLSEIYASSSKFFKKIAYILIGYLFVLVFLYPQLVNVAFERSYIVSLILILAIDSFAQFYFGITNQLLLGADQRAYIRNSIRGITLILNTSFAIIFMMCGFSIHVVKLSTAIIYLIRPICLYIYVHRRYCIDKKVVYTVEPIQQKWNGFAQHIAAVVLEGTDVLVLTIFSTIENVSIYSVYFLVTSAIKQFILSFVTGVTPMMGQLWAKGNLIKLKEVYQWIIWCYNTAFTIIYGATLVLIVPFVQVYTSGITDVNYCVPVFASILVIASFMYSLRLPFNTMILATGHFKQTQQSYTMAAILNILISIIAVNIWGLVGVAIGTFIALTYQTLWQMVYVSRYIIDISIKGILKQFFVNGLIILISYMICKFISVMGVSYISWVILAIKVVFIYSFTSLLCNLCFYRARVKEVFLRIKLYSIQWTHRKDV